jgi:hypothetical protein
MPDPYVDTATLKRELPYEAHDVGIATSSEWDDLLMDALQAATERINGWTDDGVDWLDASDTVPHLVREQTIRLARLRIANIHEDGLESETEASQASNTYRPPSDIVDEVTAALEDAGYRTTDDESSDFEFFAI